MGKEISTPVGGAHTVGRREAILVPPESPGCCTVVAGGFVEEQKFPHRGRTDAIRKNARSHSHSNGDGRHGVFAARTKTAARRNYCSDKASSEPDQHHPGRADWASASPGVPQEA